MIDIEEFQNKISYHFHNQALLLEALTHRSYANENPGANQRDNERLEFLGDAVLEIISSEILFAAYPDWAEGQLTKCRASIVCEPTLAYCCRRIDLGKYLFLGKGEDHTGGRKRPSILSDAFEAVIGAIYLDGGLAPARSFIQTFIMHDIEHMQLFHDSKTILQEIVQSRCDDALSYTLISESGPDHAKTYTVSAKIGDQVYGKGTGNTKKAAEQEAAYQTILLLKKHQGTEHVS